jgi:hypothetical protein
VDTKLTILNSFNKHIVFGFALIFSLIITSCGSNNYGNFNKQKFTNLKQFSNSNKTSNIEDDEPSLTSNLIEFETEDGTIQTSTNCDTIYRTTGETIVCKIIGETDTEIEFTNCDEEGGSSYSILKSLVADNKAENFTAPTIIEDEDAVSENNENYDDSKGIRLGNRNNFEKLSTKRQNVKRVRFRKLMNLSFFSLALGGLCLLLSIWFFWFLAGLAFIAIGWFLAIAACTTVKRINLAEQSRTFRIRYSWMAVIYAIGVIGCVVTVLGGVVLLIAWLARAI